MKLLFIDIRKSDEVYRKRFDTSEEYSVYNIPMNMIKFNEKMIKEHLEYVDEIYIVCESGSRSQFIKDKYFSENIKIKVNEQLQFSKLIHGMNPIDIGVNVSVIGSGSFNLYNIMRIIQLMYGLLILFLGGYTYKIAFMKNKNPNDKIPLVILLLVGLMAFYNGMTSTCTMSNLLKDYLN